MKYAYQELFIYKQLDFDTAQTYAVDVLILLLEPLLVRQSRAWKNHANEYFLLSLSHRY
ncbi:MAG: hypothetical protein ACI89P_001846 [Colwellia sp.]|jgi:hypothetical protein